MPGEHAFLSPSGYDGWFACPGKPALEEHEPDVSSQDADFGTEAHAFASAVLQTGKRITESGVPVPQDMLDGLTLYTNAVYDRIERYRKAGAVRVELLVEVKLDISLITGEKGAVGTADAVIIAELKNHSVLDVWDLKFGMGVEVNAEDNGQLQMYGLAAVLKYGLLHDFPEINLVIHQPRVRAEPLEWLRTMPQMAGFHLQAEKAAQLALSLRGDVTALSHLNPGDKQCRFCRVRYRCPALAEMVHKEVFGEFQAIEDGKPVPVDVTDRADALKALKGEDQRAQLLSRAMKRVDLIEKWCLDVRAHVDSDLAAGHAVPGFKLVMGRRGARFFTDPLAAETLLKDELSEADLFVPKALKSPAQLEKPVRAKGAKLWAALTELIGQKEGKPSVAPEDDPRPPWSPSDSAIRDFESYSGKDLV